MCDPQHVVVGQAAAVDSERLCAGECPVRLVGDTGSILGEMVVGRLGVGIALLAFARPDLVPDRIDTRDVGLPEQTQDVAIAVVAVAQRVVVTAEVTG